MNGSGAALAGPFRMRNAAECLRRKLQLDANRTQTAGPRLCITCGDTFESEGNHNRMCTPCRHHSEAFPGSASVAAKGARRVSKL